MHRIRHAGDLFHMGFTQSGIGEVEHSRNPLEGSSRLERTIKIPRSISYRSVMKRCVSVVADDDKPNTHFPELSGRFGCSELETRFRVGEQNHLVTTLSTNLF